MSRPQYPLRILIVGDRLEAAILFQRHGHNVQTAGGGCEAVSYAAAFRPHVVLIDTAMGGIDGYTLAERIRRNASRRKTLLLAISDDMSDGRRSGIGAFDAHVANCVDPASYAEVLDRLLMPTGSPSAR